LRRAFFSVQFDIPMLKLFTCARLDFGLRGNMSTEDRAARFIDQMGSYEATAFAVEEQKKAWEAVARAQNAIHDASMAMARQLPESTKARIIYAGAGTSIRLGAQDGAELWPTFGWPKNRVGYCIAGGKKALLESVEGAEDDVKAAKAVVTRKKICKSDVVIAVAASGRTAYTLTVLRAAKKRGALTIGIANNADTPILTEADCAIFLNTGPEPIAGSTRMIAGTAQRIVLNTLSSRVMVELGYVYNGLMINVRATNQKLKKRAIGIVQTITKCTAEAAEKVLENEKVQWEIGVAVLVLGGMDVVCAQYTFLKTHQRNLREALRIERIIKETEMST
jgi:N-acetylmuramic acid 6-phosphate etherase